jgi:GT2 family glycosyltransferase
MTVAVCTRDRPELLRRCLRSLVAQASPPAEFLVVDNAPSSRAAREVVAEFPGVRYLLEPTAGLDVARNLALLASTQPLVAFLDDDVVADPGWCAALIGPFLDDPRVAACTGRVEALTLETAGQRLFEANGGYGRGTARIRLPDDARQPLHGCRVPLVAWAVSVGNGASFAIRREAVLAIGGFDETLDRPPQVPGGGDVDLLWRLLEAGGRVVYEPDALALHEHRRELAAAFDQIVGHQRAQSVWLTKAVARSRGIRRLPLLAFLAWRLLKPGARLARRALGRDPLPARVLLRMWRGCWAGVGVYRALARSRRAAPPPHEPAGAGART